MTRIPVTWTAVRIPWLPIRRLTAREVEHKIRREILAKIERDPRFKEARAGR